MVRSNSFPDSLQVGNRPNSSNSSTSSAIGHPLVGDELYGGKRSAIDLERPFLHASFLEFEHPTRNERVSFESEIPSDLKEVLKDLSD